MKNEVLCKFLCHNICVSSWSNACWALSRCSGRRRRHQGERRAGRSAVAGGLGAERLSGVGLDLPTLGAYPNAGAISPEGVRGSAASIPPEATAILQPKHECNNHSIA